MPDLDLDALFEQPNLDLDLPELDLSELDLLEFDFTVLDLDLPDPDEVRAMFGLPPPPPPKVIRRDRPRCGARTRQGAPCQAPVVWDAALNRPRNGRCKLHGGLSTGARTAEGRARQDEARRRRWDAWRADRWGP